MLTGPVLNVVAIAEDFLRNFPEAESENRKKLINQCKTNPDSTEHARQLFALVEYLFNMYPYAELEDDDRKMYSLRMALKEHQ